MSDLDLDQDLTNLNFDQDTYNYNVSQNLLQKVEGQSTTHSPNGLTIRLRIPI